MTYNDGSAEERTSSEEIAFINIKLVKVGFSGSGNRVIRSDDGGTSYSAPHWNDPDGDGDPSDGHAYPVAYVSDTKLTISPEWKLEPAVDGVDLKIKVSGPDSISIEEVNAEVGGEKVDLASAAEDAVAFEKDKVRYWEEFELAFEASFQDQDEWVEVGTSKNQFYVTRGAPTVSPMFHTVVHLGCSNADGLESSSGIVAAIWGEFSDRDVRRVHTSAPMQYWGANAAGNADTASLLAAGDAQCGAWAHFFSDVLKAQGISSTYTGIYPDKQHDFGSGLRPAVGFGIDPSLPGQGPDAPRNAFVDHAVVRYGGVIYDPSYGETYSSEIEWEDSALTEFYYNLQATLATPDTKGVQETKFTP